MQMWLQFSQTWPSRNLECQGQRSRSGLRLGVKGAGGHRLGSSQGHGHLGCKHK